MRPPVRGDIPIPVVEALLHTDAILPVETILCVAVLLPDEVLPAVIVPLISTHFCLRTFSVDVVKVSKKTPNALGEVGVLELPYILLVLVVLVVRLLPCYDVRGLSIYALTVKPPVSLMLFRLNACM